MQASGSTETTDTVSIPAKQGNRLFPVFLKLEQLNVLLVGGGKVGLEKLNALLQNAPSAEVTVVATSVSPGVTELAQQFINVDIKERAFQETDLHNRDLVMVAVDNKATSAWIRSLAKEKKLLVNVADTPDLCDFYL
ncbi:MAG: NAD(P)-dependent oxidoreductase, partial [Bacteroidota bacterium]|nr:NAD(P)-dependent oxidoreductase [Bacteroidota bacterium]